MITMEVFEAISRDDVDPSWTWLSARWENQQRVGEVRCRYVAREFRSMDPGREGLFTPSSEPTTGRLIDFKAVKYNQLTVLLDAVNAYFNALQDGNVVVEPPREWVQAEALKGNTTKTLWKLRKKLYGQRNASVGFSDFMQGVLVGEMKFEQCPDQPCFYRHKGMGVDLELHQDDIYATGGELGLNEFVEGITKRVSMKVSKLMYHGAKYQHLKAGRVRTSEGMYLTGNAKYADAIIESLGLAKAKSVPTPIATKLLPEDFDDLCTDEEAAQYRHCVGVARFMIHYVTEAIFAVHVLSKRLSQPTKNDMLRLKRLGRYLLGVRDYALFFPKVGEVDFSECFSDSAWAGDACDRKSVACGVIVCGGCTLLEYSRGQAVQSLSSAEAEYYGGVSMSAEALHMQSVMSFLGMPTQIRLRLDSSAAKAVAQRSGVGRIRHLEVRTLWLQAKVREKKIAVIKQAGETNIADIGTKALATARFEEMRSGLGRRSTTSGDNIEETKVARVGRISQVGDEAKMGALLVTLMGFLTKALAASECVNELDGKCAIKEQAGEGYGFMIAMVVLLLVVWALGFFMGWVAKDLMQMRPQVTVRTTTTTTRTVSTQGPVTYTWRRAEPRFQPLTEEKHGAWTGE